MGRLRGSWRRRAWSGTSSGWGTLPAAAPVWIVAYYEHRVYLTSVEKRKNTAIIGNWCHWKCHPFRRCRCWCVNVGEVVTLNKGSYAVPQNVGLPKGECQTPRSPSTPIPHLHEHRGEEAPPRVIVAAPCHRLPGGAGLEQVQSHGDGFRWLCSIATKYRHPLFRAIPRSFCQDKKAMLQKYACKPESCVLTTKRKNDRTGKYFAIKICIILTTALFLGC